MNRQRRVWPALVLTLAGLMSAVLPARGETFSAARILIEVNASAEDGGIQIFVDGNSWNRLEVFDPTGQKVFDVFGSHSIGATGVTELFFESAEPSFQDLPLNQLLVRFPKGNYRFEGVTVDGKRIGGAAALSHSIPAGPRIVAPAEGATLPGTAPLAIDWDPVTQPYPGTAQPVTVTAYQVIVERVKPKPLIAFNVTLPATVTRITVPAEFVQANADYKFEVLAIEQGGNQTITEGSFKTGP
jgi:hypothetical protein